ncbi:hypothetical protein LIER_39625 [Lithospermum erythrorhizon]|uniref:Uncharacterized protein n=1 Tax=Lithospermum erythrorhizon TaxID=34254 RepID=A0AAV3QK86_LITER
MTSFRKSTISPQATLSQPRLLALINRSVTKGSASQPVEAQGEDSGPLPAFIEHSFPVPFTDTQLWDFKEYFSILDHMGLRVPVEGESIVEPLIKEGDLDGRFVWDRHRKAGVQANVPLFGSHLSANHRPFDTSLGAKGGGRMSKNFLAISHPNKVHLKQFHGQWFSIRGGMGPRVPINWTSHSEVGSLFVRDTAFLRTQVPALRQVIPVKPNWTAYCNKSSLIMTGEVWEAIQNASDPTQVDVTSMKGKRLPHFNSQVIRKPLVLGSDPIPVFPSKRRSTSEETSGTRKEKLAFPPTSVHSSKAIIPILTKTRAGSKKSKGKNASSGEESSLDCYTECYMKAPYTLSNGLSIQEGYLWTNNMNAFHVVQPLISTEEGQKHPSSDPMDAFTLSSLYMIKEHI